MPAPEWKVAIADDEPMARRGVRQLLEAWASFRVVAECRNGHEVLTRLAEDPPQVLFLDVQMPGMDGFEVIRRQTPERMPLVVFLTAHDDFALRAFEAQAFDYLVKPVTEARFATTMRRLSRQLGGERSASGEPMVSVPTSRGTLVFALREIEVIEAADNYARIWTDGRSYLLRESLNSLERRARQHGFIRAHRQVLVRIAAIRKLVPSDAEVVAVLASGKRVPVSRRRRAALVAALRHP